MNLNFLKSSILFTLSIILGAMPAMSQQRQLPAAHNAQHEELLANQRSFTTEMQTALTQKAAQEILDREALDEIYGSYWVNSSVNPYGNISVPQNMDIDVSQGVVPIKSRVSSQYGWRPRFGRMHRGVDLTLKVGDTIVAAFPGKVRVVATDPRGYGKYIVIRHDNGLETVYGHLSRYIANVNDRVEAGQPIALGGNTGRSTGPHLHFETRYLGLAVNPEWIFDFEHNTTIKDVYSFDKTAYQKAQVTSGPRKHTASSKHKKRGTKRRRR